MVNINIGVAGLSSFLGYAVVFLGIVFLMCIIYVVGVVMNRKSEQPVKETPVVNLGNINVPAGVDPKKIAIIMAALAEENRR